jgi:hypothetical protein
MRRNALQSRTRDIMALSGWLFADLLVALAMLFFTTSIDVKPIPVTPPPRPTALPRLELVRRRIRVNIDPYGILQNDPGAIKRVKQQVQAQGFLHHRRVGFVIVYGGAPNVGLIDTALNVAQKVYSILKLLGKGSAFAQSSYYDPLYVLGGNFTIVILDIYLFAQ